MEKHDMINLAADALGTAPEYRSSGCIKALVDHYKKVKADRILAVLKYDALLSDVMELVVAANGMLEHDGASGARCWDTLKFYKYRRDLRRTIAAVEARLK